MNEDPLAEKKILWAEAAQESDYALAVALKQAIETAQWTLAAQKAQELLESMQISQEIELGRALRELMTCILKWHTLPSKRSEKLARKIRRSTDEIGYLQAEQPLFDRKYLESVWEETFQKAKELVEQQAKVNLKVLTWQQVFEEEYSVKKEEQRLAERYKNLGI